MSKEAMKLAEKWQQTDWNTESPMSADFAVSEAHDVINALIDALREALAEQPAQQQEPVAPSAYESLTHDMTTIAARQVPRGVPVAEFAMHALADAELREHDAAPQPAQRKPLTPEKVVKLKDAFYAGFESYVTPAAPCSDVDEEWAKYKSAHNIKGGA